MTEETKTDEGKEHGASIVLASCKHTTINQRGNSREREVPHSPVMSSIYDGQRCVGFVLKRRKQFEGFGRDGRSMGLFASMADAADAIALGSQADE
jgi:hypothetical protein